MAQYHARPSPVVAVQLPLAQSLGTARCGQPYCRHALEAHTATGCSADGCDCLELAVPAVNRDGDDGQADWLVTTAEGATIRMSNAAFQATYAPLVNGG